VARTLITLRGLREAYPSMFAAQTWFDSEEFLDAPMETPLLRLPDKIVCRGMAPFDSTLCPTAVQLADLYVRHPLADVWHGFLWCADTDRWHQRVFVGGLGMERGFSGSGFQIHRFVTFTEDWGIPVWDAA
jgi:hypothetical protein